MYPVPRVGIRRMPDLAVESRTKLRFPSSRCSRLGHSIWASYSPCFASPPSPIPLQSSFFAVCSLATVPSSPKPDSAATYHLLCCAVREMPARLVQEQPAFQMRLVLHVSSYTDPACRDCPSTPLSGMLGQRRSGRCQGYSGLEPSRRYWYVLVAVLGQPPPNPGLIHTARNASAPYHAIQVCVERARLFVVCLPPGLLVLSHHQ